VYKPKNRLGDAWMLSMIFGGVQPSMVICMFSQDPCSASAVAPLAQARDKAWQEEEEEHADHNLRRVTIERRKKGLRSSTKMDFLRL
jgi:hypothetical protein